MADDPVLSVRRLGKTCSTAAGPLAVLHEINLEIGAGSSVAIMGPSGSGKTTLLALCAGLDKPSAGSVEALGSRLEELTEDQRANFRRAHVGFVFQNFHLIPTMTALENVLLPLELDGRAGGGSAAEELLEQVGLAARRHHFPAQLSGGEQQRVALARACINRPRLLFCDEPTGNLDEETARATSELIFAMHREHRSTLVLVTHNPELAARCGRIVRLKGGAVVDDRRPGGP